MDLMEYLQRLCKKLTEFFFRSFGDYTDSQSGDKIIPAGTDWNLIASMGKPSILRLFNTSLADEMQYTFNDKNPIGMRIPKQTGDFVDSVSGLVWVKMSDPTKTGVLNVGIISLITHDQ